MKLVDKI
jgi:hypothetical protein